MLIVLTLVAGVGAALLKDFEEGPPRAQPTATLTSTLSPTSPTPTQTVSESPTDEPTDDPTAEPTAEPTDEPEVPPLPRSGVTETALGLVLLVLGAALVRWQHAAGY